MRALAKDILRTIGHEKKRFFSILLITMLGVTMMTGLRASCNDLRWSADALYDEQRLFDIQVSSTLGLDDEDIAALSTLDEAAYVEGEYAENAFTEVNGVHEEVTVRTLGEQINIPTVLEGTLPRADDEIAVTEHYMTQSGKQLGDTLTFAREQSEDGEEDEPVFAETPYTITAVVLDPFDLNDREHAVSFRDAASTEYTFFVLPSAADTDIYTSVYVYLKGTKELMCYGDAYSQIVQRVKGEINDTLKQERQQGRYETVLGDAMDAYNEACDEVMAQLDDAQADLDDAQRSLDDGQQELDDGMAELADARIELDAGKEELTEQERDAESQINAGMAQIEAGYRSLDESKADLDEAAAQIADGEQQLEEATQALAAAEADTLGQLDDEIAQNTAAQSALQDQIDQAASDQAALEDQIDVLQAQIAALESEDPEGDAALLEELREQLAALESEKSAADSALTALQGQMTGLTVQLSAFKAQRTAAESVFAAAEEEIEAQAAQLAEGKQAYESGLAQWNAGKQELDAGMAELNRQAAEAQIQISEAWEAIYAGEEDLDDAQQQLDDGQQELNEGRQELEDGRTQLEESTETAMAELADAREEIEKIEVARWYIQSRTSLSGYSNVSSDADSIQGLGNFIPLIFFIVAILISLTAITRMVEEDRGLIGTYKALGFKNREIRRKYLVYAAAASLIGGVLGDFCGFVVLPKIIFAFFNVMYRIPNYLIRFEPASGIIGIAMFTVGILLAVLYAVHGALLHMPAMLMRPAVPKSGTRIFLERIPVFWKRLSFLNKVTARNLFRYKRRLLMTVIGIMGCTALLVCGFAIKNTVTDLMPKQYDDIVRYDILAVATDNDELLSYMDDPENIESYVNLEVDSMTLITPSEDETTVQVFVIPDDAPIFEFLKLADVDGNEAQLPDDGIFVTHSVEKVLGVEAGDVVTLQDLSLNEADCPVALVAENYLGDIVYVSQSGYEELFGKETEPNAVLIRLTGNCQGEDAIAYSNELGTRDGLLSTTSTEDLRETFSQSFAIMNVVVYVILVLAAGLAFVVLFTLATTNISERERELATIKVLGFFDSEVHLYVNKETVILSCIGIALGLPLGRILSGMLCWLLKIPGIYFAVSVHVSTYILCAGTAVVFTLIVNQITNRILNHIDPAVALKSIE